MRGVTTKIRADVHERFEAIRRRAEAQPDPETVHNPMPKINYGRDNYRVPVKRPKDVRPYAELATDSRGWDDDDGDAA